MGSDAPGKDAPSSLDPDHGIVGASVGIGGMPEAAEAGVGADGTGGGLPASGEIVPPLWAPGGTWPRGCSGTLNGF